MLVRATIMTPTRPRARRTSWIGARSPRPRTVRTLRPSTNIRARADHTVAAAAGFAAAARRFFQRAIGTTKVTPVEVTTDKAPGYPAVLEALLPAAWHDTDQYANNGIACDHGSELPPNPDNVLTAEADRLLG
jgi:DDE domain